MRLVPWLGSECIRASVATCACPTGAGDPRAVPSTVRFVTAADEHAPSPRKGIVVTRVDRFRARSRARRAVLFRRELTIERGTRILDLGSEDGSHVASVITPLDVDPADVYIADIDAAAVARGAERFGFSPVVIPEDGLLPFPDGYFDVVFCSSVIEHVTGDKEEAKRTRDGRFATEADRHQRMFAGEIRRIGKRYFVQTPNRWFPIESHSWLPLVGFLPRPLLVPLLRFTNRWWIKKTIPDFRLLTAGELSDLFPDARIFRERSFGLVKSVIAIR